MAGCNHDPLVDEQSLRRQLQRKSHHRRKDLLQLAKASAAPRASRNDPLPHLELAQAQLQACPGARNFHDFPLDEIAAYL
jgi:hypothetical protein